MPIMHSIYRESGKPTIDADTCSQCGACAKICPAEVLTMDDGNIRVRDDSFFGCIACGHCMMVCPEGAIKVTGRGISPEDLLPLPAPENKAGADALAALMQSRRSVRRFSDREVDAELLERIVEMASTAPMGIPPWDVGCVTVRGREQVQQITAEVVKGYEGFLKIFKPWLLTIMRPFVGRAKYEMFTHFIRPLAEMYVGGHREGRDTVFHGAPALLIFYHSPYADSADAVIPCTYAMLAAESLGLGSTVIGGAPPVLQRNKALCQKLGIPAGSKPSISLILGYPATKFRHAIRRRFVGAGTA
ncbi:MAG: nitroreductase family protein [Phycisphaerales bacterium]|nr:MAG: nitroreductase family protein [Phycisphaerales bacterium]